MSVFSVNVFTLKFTKTGIKEYNGAINDQAFAWTGADKKCSVNETVVKYSNWVTVISRTENDGYVQTPQATYRKASVMGLHSAVSGSRSISDRTSP